MLQINGKTFMNLQEAVQWLLDNNALPFQSSANYIANTEIGMGTIVNPSPAKVRIGSLIFFADSKVSTVIGLTENGFICSDQYNDLVDDVVYVSNVAINASGRLIVTLSNGTNIDAGIIRQVSSFTINASQHLIVNYNDGTTTDLGAIFSGNVNIAGNFTANSIIENMVNYTFTLGETDADLEIEGVYAGVVKNGNKITFAIAINATRLQTVTSYREFKEIGAFFVPYEVFSRLYPGYTDGGFGGVLGVAKVQCATTNTYFKELNVLCAKSGGGVRFELLGLNTLDLNTKYYLRAELTLLLSDNLAI